jgi:HlyD family secretion protein
MSTQLKEQRMNTYLALGVLVGVIAVVCVIGIITFHKETEYLQGQAEVSEYRVSSKVPGRILEFRVQEGQRVRKGDTLAILEAPEVEAKKAQAEALEQQAIALNAKAQAGARKPQIEGAYEMWQKAKVGVDIAEKSFNRISNLYQDGVVTAQKYDEVKAQRDAAIATEKAALSQYRLALDGAQEEDKDMAAAKVLQAQGAVAEVNSYINETVLTAYADGEVTEIFPHVGELVGTGAPVMNVAQMDDQWVTFNVREDCLRDFAIGTEFDAYVPALDRSIRMRVSYMKDIGDFAAWKATKETGQYDLKTFEVRATPLSVASDLRPGMSVVVEKKQRR